MAYFQLATVATALVQTELCMHLYLNQVASGPYTNQFPVAGPTNWYGHTVVNDWSLTTAPGANSTVVGHARGLDMLASPAKNQWYFSSNLWFEDARYSIYFVHRIFMHYHLLICFVKFLHKCNIYICVKHQLWHFSLTAY